MYRFAKGAAFGEKDGSDEEGYGWDEREHEKGESS